MVEALVWVRLGDANCGEEVGLLGAGAESLSLGRCVQGG